MKKGFRTYAAVWLIVLAAFNAVCFLTPRELAGYTKLDAAFWTAYAVMTLAFIGQLACAFFAFRAKDARSFFYHIPLITVSYTGLIVSLAGGGITIVIPNLPAWVGAVIGVMVLCFTAAAVIKANAAAEIVKTLDEKVKAQTSLIRNLTAEAESLMSQAESEEAKAVCKKIYEVLRYSDPRSYPGLSAIESQITVKMNQFSVTAGTDDANMVKVIGNELVILLEERNRQCKVLK